VTEPLLDTTNFWLAVIAMIGLVQLQLLAIAGVVLYGAYRDLTGRIEAFQQQQLQPLTARINAVLDDARDVLDRVKAADDGMRRALDRTGSTVRHVAGLARSRLWPVLGLLRGVKAAAAHFTRRSRQGIADADARSGRPRAHIVHEA
jgi:hypothetical protein